MAIHLIPKTTPGKWVTNLVVSFFILFGLFYLAIATGQRGGEGFFDNLFLTIPALLAAICAIVAFFVGLISIIKNEERSVLVFLSTLIGLLVLLWVLAEIMFPH